MKTELAADANALIPDRARVLDAVCIHLVGARSLGDIVRQERDNGQRQIIIAGYWER